LKTQPIILKHLTWCFIISTMGGCSILFEPGPLLFMQISQTSLKNHRPKAKTFSLLPILGYNTSANKCNDWIYLSILATAPNP
ncbi:hypothetical protein, partial [Moraxella cuniculi]|uniref:hypothetical protein n=1 Tax=Moraxella cuniculi TaxID=34061 RepID=UPI001D0D0652